VTVGDGRRVRIVPTDELSRAEITAIRALLVAAFASDEDGGFADDDWDHAIGGQHFVLDLDGGIVAHASVVEREIHVGGHALRTGYVEAVATAPEQQGAGWGSLVMRDVSAFIRAGFELGALGTGRHRFYERLGWQMWMGPTSVRTPTGTEPTPGEDGHVLVLTTPTTPPIDLTGPISCDWRLGDVW
jgi:aminoglycoside 2'-N-acetyltransferase I